MNIYIFCSTETSLDREAATSVPITSLDDMDLLPPPTPTAKKTTATMTSNQKTLPVSISWWPYSISYVTDEKPIQNCPTPSPSPASATTAASHIALSIDENFRVPPHLRMRCQIEIFQFSIGQVPKPANWQTFFSAEKPPINKFVDWVSLQHLWWLIKIFKQVKFPWSKYYNISVITSRKTFL